MHNKVHRKQSYMSRREHIIGEVFDAFQPKIGICTKQGYVITKYVQMLWLHVE